MGLRRVRLGRSDLSVLPLCLGGNVFGWTLDEKGSFAVLDAYAAAGGNFIDTADVYARWAPGNAGGESETIIGRWMASRGNRNDVVLATKVGAMGPLNEQHIHPQIEASLARLRTDHIDLYYVHRDDPSTPLPDTLSVLDALVREGKVRHLAASNYSAERLREALDLSDAHDLAGFVALQPRYNLVEREGFEGDLLALCRERGLACLPYQALAGGFLSGKYRRGATITGPRSHEVAPHADERGWAALEALEATARVRGASVAACALAWLGAQPTVAAPLASATSPGQLAELLSSLTLTLTTDELASLDSASRVAA
jgi:aryl-alcohol dehydrogenase-like predicted oxidoreductase